MAERSNEIVGISAPRDMMAIVVVIVSPNVAQRTVGGKAHYISDARMSGTAYGTIVLHVSPEAAVGGPLAFVRDGDRIALSVAKRRLDLLVDEAELAKRRAAHRPATHEGMRGYARLYMQSVMQAEDGCDFDFLRKV